MIVGNIPYEAKVEQLKEIFERIGQVISFKLQYNEKSGKPMGYGFCKYRDRENAEIAIERMNKFEFLGRQLIVKRHTKKFGGGGYDQNQNQNPNPKGLKKKMGMQDQQINYSNYNNNPYNSYGNYDNNNNFNTSNNTPNNNINNPINNNMNNPINNLNNNNINSNPINNNLGNQNPTIPNDKMSDMQLYQILAYFKMLFQQNPLSVQQYIQSSPQLTYALMNAQLILGIAPNILHEIKNSLIGNTNTPTPSPINANRPPTNNPFPSSSLNPNPYYNPSSNPPNNPNMMANPQNDQIHNLLISILNTNINQIAKFPTDQQLKILELVRIASANRSFLESLDSQQQNKLVEVVKVLSSNQRN